MTDPIKILDKLKNSDENGRTEISGQINSDMINGWLSNGNWKIRNAAIKIISELKLNEFSESITEILTDRQSVRFIDRLFGGDFYQVGFIRRNAADALGTIGKPDDSTASALTIALSDPYWEVRVKAAKACGDIFGTDIPEALFQAVLAKFNDPAFEVVVEAVKTAGKAGKNILINLRKLYNHPNSLVKLEVRSLIKSLLDNGIIADKETYNKEIRNIFVPGNYNNIG